MENQLNAAYYASSAVMNPSASKPINYQEDESTSGPKKKKKTWSGRGAGIFIVSAAS